MKSSAEVCIVCCKSNCKYIQLWCAVADETCETEHKPCSVCFLIFRVKLWSKCGSNNHAKTIDILIQKNMTETHIYSYYHHPVKLHRRHRYYQSCTSQHGVDSVSATHPKDSLAGEVVSPWLFEPSLKRWWNFMPGNTLCWFWRLAGDCSNSPSRTQILHILILCCPLNQPPEHGVDLLPDHRRWHQHPKQGRNKAQGFMALEGPNHT